MTIRPIIFSVPMVRALLAGRKTQTRRITPCPLMKTEVGDLLYVREAFRPWQVDELASCGCSDHCEHVGPLPSTVCCRADGPDLDADQRDMGLRWKPSIHMPRAASRLTLRVKRVFHDPIQRISSADAIAEGIAPAANSQTIDCDTPDPRDSFRALWDSLHTKPGETWADNPMVVALEFDVIHGNVDKIAGGDDEQAA